MDGYKIIVVSGIDGSHTDFVNYIEPYLSCKDYMKISYDRSMSFLQNIRAIRNVISNMNNLCCLIGWSIGAVAVAFLANVKNVKVVVMINPFFTRSEILKRRNIFCDEEVCLSSTIKQPVKYIIIAGKEDDKIPYTESLKISKYYNVRTKNLYLISNAKHSLDSFPEGKISDIINSCLL